MAYLHPLLGFAAVAFLVWVATRGLRARQRRPDAPRARAQHRRLAPVVLVLSGLVAGIGFASAYGLRDDLDPGQSWHLKVELTVLTLLLAAGFCSLQFTRHPSARRVHAALGLLAVLAAVVGLLLGLGILPD